MFNNPITIVWAALFIILLVVAVKYIYESSSNGLKRKVKKLGNAKGKSLDEIVFALGTPSSTVRISSNKIVKRWTTKKYKVAFTFNQKNICTGVAEES